MYKLPKGIQKLERSNKDGQKIVAFRVQMNRQGVKFDQLHPTLEQALKALNEHRTALKLKPFLLEIDTQALKNALDSEEGKQFIADFMGNPSFSQYVKKYIEIYLNTKNSSFLNKKLDDMTAEEKNKLKNHRNITSQFSRIVKVKIDNFEPITLDVISKGFNRQSVKFGDLKIEEITPNVINSYVKTRIQDGMRGQTIRQEIIHINSVFKKIKHLNSGLSNLPNPINDYDKELLKLAVKPKSKFFRFNEDSKQEFIQAIEQNKNPEFIYIVKLMLLTAMRRSEVILLKWSQIHENFIELTDTKTDARLVYLTAETQELIKTIPKKPNQDRLFTYTVGGFEASYSYHLKKFGLEKTTAHKLRKNAISEFVEKIGSNNSLLIAEILGIRDMKSLENSIKQSPTIGLNSQDDVLKSIGHKSSAVTKKHYFSLKKNN